MRSRDPPRRYLRGLGRRWPAARRRGAVSAHAFCDELTLGARILRSGGAALLGPEFLMEVMELREELEARPAAPRLLELRDQNRGEAARLGAARGADSHVAAVRVHIWRDRGEKRRSWKPTER